MLNSFRLLHERYVETYELQESIIDQLRAKLWKFEVDSYKTREGLLRFVNEWEAYLKSSSVSDVMNRMAMTFVQLGHEALDGRLKN